MAQQEQMYWNETGYVEDSVSLLYMFYSVCVDSRE